MSNGFTPHFPNSMLFNHSNFAGPSTPSTPTPGPTSSLVNLAGLHSLGASQTANTPPYTAGAPGGTEGMNGPAQGADIFAARMLSNMAMQSTTMNAANLSGGDWTHIGQQILAQGTDTALKLAGNAAYLSLEKELKNVQDEISKLVAELNTTRQDLKTTRELFQILAHGVTLNEQLRGSNGHPTLTLLLDGMGRLDDEKAPCLSSDECNVRYYLRKDWFDARGKAANIPGVNGVQSSKDEVRADMRFLEHRDGTTIKRSEFQEISLTIRQAFWTLVQLGIAPDTWGNIWKKVLLRSIPPQCYGEGVANECTPTKLRVFLANAWSFATPWDSNRVNAAQGFVPARRAFSLSSPHPPPLLSLLVQQQTRLILSLSQYSTYDVRFPARLRLFKSFLLQVRTVSLTSGKLASNHHTDPPLDGVNDFNALSVSCKPVMSADTKFTRFDGSRVSRMAFSTSERRMRRDAPCSFDQHFRPSHCSLFTSPSQAILFPSAWRPLPCELSRASVKAALTGTVVSRTPSAPYHPSFFQMNATSFAAQLVYRHCRLHHDVFQFCSGDWKAHQLATHIYSDFHKTWEKEQSQSAQRGSSTEPARTRGGGTPGVGPNSSSAAAPAVPLTVNVATPIAGASGQIPNAAPTVMSATAAVVPPMPNVEETRTSTPVPQPLPTPPSSTTPPTPPTPMIATTSLFPPTPTTHSARSDESEPSIAPMPDLGDTELPETTSTSTSSAVQPPLPPSEPRDHGETGNASAQSTSSASPTATLPSTSTQSSSAGESRTNAPLMVNPFANLSFSNVKSAVPDPESSLSTGPGQLERARDSQPESHTNGLENTHSTSDRTLSTPAITPQSPTPSNDTHTPSESQVPAVPNVQSSSSGQQVGTKRASTAGARANATKKAKTTGSGGSSSRYGPQMAAKEDWFKTREANAENKAAFDIYWKNLTGNERKHWEQVSKAYKAAQAGAK
ncbi:hypothetical protein EIP91_001438 [Steccherinum ochraceum]|uniref:Uncharacterized protein n=1 Tax=Steccherinum ochraceum TaxID=92696 RepID=A0A4R0RMI0_9APHY|nr:hypothetical protein EIP91_001438 [Steccherinum ochraceum]